MQRYKYLHTDRYHSIQKFRLKDGIT